jgi:hypothetical protein
MEAFPLFQREVWAFAFDRESVIFDLEVNRFRLHPRKLNNELISRLVLVDIHRRGPGTLAVLLTEIARPNIVKKERELPLGLCEFTHRIPVIVLHIRSSYHYTAMEGKSPRRDVKGKKENFK